MSGARRNAGADSGGFSVAEREVERAKAGRHMADRSAVRVDKGTAAPGWLLAALTEMVELDGRVLVPGPATRAFLRDLEGHFARGGG